MLLRMRPYISALTKPIFLFLLLSGFIPLSADAVLSDFSGPVRGQNTYLPYRLFLFTPALPSSALDQGTLEAGFQLYLTNDFHSYVTGTEDLPEHERISDYENILLEAQLQYQLTSAVSVIGIFGITAYCGGFLDPVIENFHKLFWFRNAGREYFPDNEVYIDIQNDNGMDIFGDKPEVAIEDWDIWVKYAFPVASASWQPALWTGVKVPVGAVWGSGIISTGYPDIGILMSSDHVLLPFLALYLQAGATVPLNAAFTAGEETPYPFASGLICTEWRISGSWSILGQMNIKTRVLSGGIRHWFFTETDRLSLPQTNVIAAVTRTTGKGTWQFYFEEDFLTNQGADITVGIQYRIMFPKRGTR